ncbi:hypothetical protein DSO57_1031523 [Entomophthora muscae]|uniref:Uncharacterized protein n=1 Tax=Entomophthora muscae TaxID=34485 RepID=A0ACC2S2R0_9FUNG|nr:hypothetical protein DSO57_1031523 [Entomophthora muscae]
MAAPSSRSLATIQDTLWGLVDRNPTISFKLVYATQPNIIQAQSGPMLEIPDKVLPLSDPQVIQANSEQSEKEEKILKKTLIPIKDRQGVGNKVWVMNTNKMGSAIILKTQKTKTGQNPAP